MVAPLVIGHQGCDGLRPGNTLAAFRHAVALGADVLECDVHRTRDGRLAIMHDARVDRTTGASGSIAEMDMDALRALDAGGGEPVPELDDLLAFASGRVRLAVELKSPGSALPALEAVRARDLLGATTFISFQMPLLAEVRAAEPLARTGALFARGGAEVVALARAAGASVLDLQFTSATAQVLEAARAAGVELWVWTPDAVADLRRMVDLGADGITTNRPDRLRAILDGAGTGHAGAVPPIPPPGLNCSS